MKPEFLSLTPTYYPSPLSAQPQWTINYLQSNLLISSALTCFLGHFLSPWLHVLKAEPMNSYSSCKTPTPMAPPFHKAFSDPPKQNSQFPHLGRSSFCLALSRLSVPSPILLQSSGLQIQTGL